MGLKAMLKKSRFTYTAALALKRAPEPFLRAYMAICHAIVRVDPKKVYFSSFSGKLYNENPKYVAQTLHEICPEAKIVFRLNAAGRAQGDLPDYVHVVSQFSPAALCAMATARVIVKNARFKPYMKKFSDQTYIQLWHGDRGIKKIIFDLEPGATKKYIDWKYMDIGVCGSDFGERTYMRKSFGFEGELIKKGIPKNDLLLNPPAGTAEAVRAKLKIPAGVHTLLYAPTFRDRTTGSAMPANFSLKKLRETLEAASGEKWQILTRGHSLNSGVDADEGMDVSAYPDVSCLLLATDYLITDYSSIAGDYLLLDRPILLFHGDRDRYTTVDRTLAFDPEQSPYRIAHSEEELLRMAAEPFDAAENCRALKEFYGVYETGHASMAVAERIRDILQK